jgi:photosystem II stability/assembly factor-like uncharacterized protein
MHRFASLLGRRGVAFVVLIVTASVMVAPLHDVRAADGWQTTSLTGIIYRLDAPMSGALFAWTEWTLHRSDDAGETWHTVALPPAFASQAARARGVVVDPVNHTRMFLDGWVTDDDGATWTPLGDWPVHDQETPRLLVSAADPNLLYLAVKSVPSVKEGVRFLRSRDAGNSWEQTSIVRSAENVRMSVLGVTLFEAHPSDPGVVFQTVVEFNAGARDGAVGRSADQGSTVIDVLFRPSRRPEHLVGGWGAGAHRFYCPLGPELYRSDDDGVTWQMVASFEAEGREIFDLDVDPTDPNRVYVIFRTGQVRSSHDGGLTWADLGTPDDYVHDLALGVDQKNLYVAAGHGVMRLPLR